MTKSSNEFEERKFLNLTEGGKQRVVTAGLLKVKRKKIASS
jgi:hypothetical protein